MGTTLQLNYFDMKLYTVYVLAFLLTNFHFLSALNSQSLGLPVWPLVTGFEQSVHRRE